VKPILLALAGAAAATVLATGPAATAADPASSSPTASSPAATAAVWVFEGYTSTDGRSCGLEGQQLVAAFPLTNRAYLCKFGNPNPGTYNLWIYYLDPAPRG
jgi:hypothetical protein